MPPLFDEDFPEYDAVPNNLGPLIPGFIPIQRSQTQQSETDPEDPAEFLFTANLGFGLPTSQRSKRKHGKVLLVGKGLTINHFSFQAGRKTNSHGGPVNYNLIKPSCSSNLRINNVELLTKTFPMCSYLLEDCGIDSKDNITVIMFGRCLNKKYDILD